MIQISYTYIFVHIYILIYIQGIACRVTIDSVILRRNLDRDVQLNDYKILA